MTALPAPDRRLAERRVSPAVGQFAIQECARLKQVNAELVAALIYWLPEHQPLQGQFDLPSLDHKQRWNEARTAIEKAKS